MARLSVVAPSVGSMPVTMQERWIRALDEARPAPIRPASSREVEPAEGDTCDCEECRGTARDDMWTRWG